jgi:hypothetical protein
VAGGEAEGGDENSRGTTAGGAGARAQQSAASAQPHAQPGVSQPPPPPSAANPFRSLGNAMEEWKKRLNMVRSLRLAELAGWR